MTTKTLIAGASIAGPALAFWLSRVGHDVTLVDRAPAFRTGGQTVDVRGPARAILRRMGLERTVRTTGSAERGTRFVDADNAIRAQFEKNQPGADGFTPELEILRDDLAHILLDATPGLEPRYDTCIAALAQADDHVDVTFADGHAEPFDLVFAAEGIGSPTRRMLFGNNARRVPFDYYMSCFTIPRTPADGDYARWFNAPGGRSVLLRPDRHGTTRVLLTLEQKPCGYEQLAPEEQRKILLLRFLEAGWETPRVLEALRAADDFYFEMIGQIHLDHWHQGRVCLLGDAAWAPGHVSGQAASLAIIGAYVLAGELARRRTPQAAFAAYETVMRPFVDRAQDISKLGPKLLQPQTEFGIAVEHTLLGIAANPAIRKLGAMLSPKPTAPDLPAYNLPVQPPR